MRSNPGWPAMTRAMTAMTDAADAHRPELGPARAHGPECPDFRTRASERKEKKSDDAGASGCSRPRPGGAACGQARGFGSGQRAGRRAPAAGGRRESASSAGILLQTLFILLLSRHADGWISLSSQGYQVKHSLVAQAGVKVQGDVEVNGMTISKPVAKLQCNPSRRGAVRWNDDAFEGCDGQTDWRPLTFCSRSCTINTNSVPCNLPVRNRCDKSCNQYGTGLNMRQCILNVASTPCQHVVRDLCGNACGLQGQLQCDSMHKDTGNMVIRALDRANVSSSANDAFVPSSSSYALGMRKMTHGNFDSGLFWTYKNDANGADEVIFPIMILLVSNGTDKRVGPVCRPQGAGSDNFGWQDMVVFQKIEENSVPPNLVSPRGPSDHQPATGKPFGTTRGMEISKPPSDDEATLRVSMYTEMTGGYIRIGEDYNSMEKEKMSFIYIDSSVEKECPFLMNAANYDGQNKYTRVCLQPATDQPREILLPDASGVVITDGSTADLRSLPGLRPMEGQSSMMYRGKYKDKTHISPPPLPRVDCSKFSCSNPNFNRAHFNFSHCNQLNYDNAEFDMYRLFYGLTKDISATNWSKEVKEIVHAISSNPNTVQDAARVFVSLQVIESGLDVTDLDVEAELMQQYRFGPIGSQERCFVCCCNAVRATSPKLNPSNLTNAERGVCPYTRERPSFCLSGPKIAQQCIDDNDCLDAAEKKGGVCGYDPEVVTCLLSDQGWVCWEVFHRDLLFTRVDFVEPEAFRFLKVPAVSGTFVSTGNLQDITSMGVQLTPIEVVSSHNTSTKIVFERNHPEMQHLRQVNQDILNNTLLFPNNLDNAMLITTGNLEDITLNSTAMTGLRVHGDVHIQRMLKFGDNSVNNGILLAPQLPSAVYTTPHSGRPSSYAQPGQLSFRVHDSQTVLEFEPPQDGKKFSTITIPARSGTILTTGNLEAVTAQSGSMHSLAVDWLSYLQGGVVVGEKGVTQLTLQGHSNHTMTFESMRLKAQSRDEFSKTMVAFDLPPLHSTETSKLVWPATSGIVLTTGNMPDAHEYTGSSTKTKEAHFRGPTFVGPGPTAGQTGEHPILLSGYVTGQIVHRYAKKVSELHRPPEQFTRPFTWDLLAFSSCKQLPGFLGDGNFVKSPTFETPRFNVDPWSVKIMSAPVDACRAECESKPGCGVLFASRYWRVKMLSLQDYMPSSDPGDSLTNYVSNVIRRPAASSNGFLAEDHCYPGFSPVFEGDGLQDVVPFSAKFDYVMNLTKYPEIETYWTTDSSCQGVIAAREKDWKLQFGNAWQGFNEIHLQPVKCGNSICTDLEDCEMRTQECTVMIQSRVNGAYLTGSQAADCIDQLVASKPCARWTNNITIWTAIPFHLNRDNPRYDDWKSLQTDTLFRFRRKGVCGVLSNAKLGHATSFTATCDGDIVQDVAVWWGDVEGVCGGFQNTSKQCAAHGDVLSLLQEQCLGDGCTISLLEQSEIPRLQVKSTKPGSQIQELTGRGCKGKRLAVEFVCREQLYLGKPKAGVKPHFQMFASGNDDNTLFHLHSSLEVPSSSLNQTVEIHKDIMWRECWLSKEPAHDCALQPDTGLDVHIFMRYDSLSLAFSSPSQIREQRFPDVSGLIISTGNLKDVTNLPGLNWKDAFVFKHMPVEELRDGDYPYAPVTFVDFAFIGSGNIDRSDGTLPPEFSLPRGANRRIVFPDSSGTIITTGNIDDLLFKKLNLEGMHLDGEIVFKNKVGPLVTIRFEDTSRIAGCLNMVKERGEYAYDHYTQFCREDPSQMNMIKLPDASGRILTTGNLLNLPSMRIVESQLLVGQDVTMERNIEAGHENDVTFMKAYTRIDGDVGLTFASPNNSVSVHGDVLGLHAPHMGGVDIALRHYLTDGAPSLKVSVRSTTLYASGDSIVEHPIRGTSMINQTMCYDLLMQHHVHGVHGLGYFLLERRLITQTIVSGTPYWGVEVPGNQTFPACVHVPSGTIVCEKRKNFNDCACRGLGERMMVRWRRIGKQLIRGQSDRCPDQTVKNCHYTESRCDPSTFDDAGCAFDGNVLTSYRSTNQSRFMPTPYVEPEAVVLGLEDFGTNAFPEGMSEDGRCILGLRFHRSVGISMVRVFPSSTNVLMVGGKLQASPDADGENWVDLHEFVHQPPRGIWTTVLLPQFRDSRFVFLRYLGPACTMADEACTCEAGEWEWHQGRVSSLISATDRGDRSYYVDEEALRQDPEGAMTLACASNGWLPAKLQSDVNELVIPEASGIVLTTGNLEDVTKLAGSITSVEVSGEAHIGGSTVLGARGENTEGHWNSLLTGRFPLAMGGGGNYDAASFLSMSDPSVDNLVYWPPASNGGSVLTTGMLPSLRDHMSIVGNAAVRGPTEMNHDVVIGNLLHPSTLTLHSSISTVFPLTFKDASTPDEQKLVLGMEEPSGDRVLMLPDITGTVITTGNLPDVLEAVTLIGDTVFDGVVKFVKEDVSFGAPDAKINMAIHTALGGRVPLKFEGREADGRILSFSVEEPSGQNVVSLPDVTGTVITTGNFPETVDNLKVLGNLDLVGNVIIIGRKISIGHDELKTKLAVNSIVNGRFPLIFGHVSDANPMNESLAATTTFEIIPPTGDNVITLPDTSGTVITTGNIPTTIMMPTEYTLEVKAFVAIASSAFLGQGARDGSAEGSFTFTDSSELSEPSTFESKANSFNVRATGGFKFITGYTASNCELGVVLESKSSSWSILSDEKSKLKVAAVDDLDALQKICSIPISTWRYQGQEISHMGPMAQDLHAAFDVGEADRISSADADGVILSAVRGLTRLRAGLEDHVQSVQAGIANNHRKILEQTSKMARQEERISSVLARLDALERMARGEHPLIS